MYGFTKHERDSIDKQELEVFRLLSANLLHYTAAQLATACTAGELFEVKQHEQNPQDHP